MIALMKLFFLTMPAFASMENDATMDLFAKKTELVGGQKGTRAEHTVADAKALVEVAKPKKKKDTWDETKVKTTKLLIAWTFIFSFFSFIVASLAYLYLYFCSEAKDQAEAADPKFEFQAGGKCVFKSAAAQAQAKTGATNVQVQAGLCAVGSWFCGGAVNEKANKKNPKANKKNPYCWVCNDIICNWACYDYCCCKLYQNEQ